MTIVEMRVSMDCPGCERKIKKALSKLDGLTITSNFYKIFRRTNVYLNGVDNIEIDMNMQKVTVIGWADQNKVLKTVRKTGRTAELWPYPYNPEYHDYYNHYYGSTTPANYFDSEPSDYFIAAKPISTYNYRKHGYNGHEHGYYQKPPSSAILDDQTATMFSDDNATGCSIM